MKKYQLTLLSLCVAAFAQAKVTLPSFFTDNMVIQQNSQLTLPGKAKAGKQVTVKVSWNHEKYTAKASADGHFSIEVPTPPAGGPYQIIVSDGEKLVLNNVLSGEVWICSGQSNMEMPVAGWGKVMNYEQEVADANYPSIRLLQVKKTVAFSPQDNVEMNMNGWQECSSATVPEFSSVAYFYARKLWKELNVPVGVIDCTWGGTPAESWTSHQTLKQVMGFQKKMAEMESAGFQREKLVELYHREMDEWLQQFDAKDPGFKDGVPQWISALQTGNEWKPMELPAYWETRGLNFDGTVWFQKEVEIPADWSGKEISFHLAMIDDDDVTYFNGKEIGRTSGCNTMRTYKIPATLAKAGKGVITIRAIDYGGEGGIHGEPQQMYMEANGKKISLAGNWNYHTGVSMTDAPSRPLSPEGTGWPTSCYPTVLYNAMIHPFTVFPIKGAIWYQGENNVGFDEQYRVLFQSMITDWRRAWKQDFPFYFVQLANYLKPEEVQPDSKWAALRDAQAVQSRHRQQHTDPHRLGHPLFQENAENGHQHDVKCGDEARLADLGVVHEPELLKRLAAEEAQAASRAPEKEHLHVGGRGAARVLRGIRGGEPRAVPQDEGQQHEGAKEHARRREGEGTDVVHPDRLRDEAQAPDRGRDEEKNGLAKLKERHDGSVLLGMLFFFRAESAHFINRLSK